MGEPKVVRIGRARTETDEPDVPRPERPEADR